MICTTLTRNTDIVTPWAPDGARKRKWKFPGDLYFSCTHNTHNLAWAHLSLCFVGAGQTGLTCPVQPDNLRPVFTDTSPRPQLLEISLNQVMTPLSAFNKCLKVFLSTTLFKMSNERLVKPVWRSGLSSHLTKRVHNKNLKDFVVVKLIYTWLMSLMSVRILTSNLHVLALSSQRVA